MTNLTAEKSWLGQIQDFGKRVQDNLEKVIVGKRAVLELTVIGLLARGHILIEDVPGVGKTMLARSLARSLGCTFSRIQFTPDMLPSDVTGISLFNQSTRQFEFRPGPIHAQVVLADEINRATPKTQSALLEAMEERQTTVDGITHPLAEPFLVLATQNPIEYEGTFPLPEAQLDRFLMRIRLGYPSQADEIQVITDQEKEHPIQTLTAITDQEELRLIQQLVRNVHLSDPIKKYITSITRATRDNADVYVGSSPRGSLGLARTSQVRAGLAGRDFVLPDDVKYLADYVLAHRMVINPAARLKNLSQSQVVQEVLLHTPVPGGVQP